MWSVLRVRDYRLLAAGQLLSGLGDWLLLVAAPFHVLRLTGSTLATGLSMAAETVPVLLLGPVAGVLADRWDRRRTMIVTDVLRGAVVSSLVLVHRPDQVWLVYVALAGESAIGQFFAPSRQALVPAVVGRGPLLPAASSLAALINGAVRLLGGPIGGALYGLAGFAPVVLLDVASYAASAVLITAIRHRTPVAERPASDERLLPRFARELKEGAAHVRDAAGLAAVFTAATIFFVSNAALSALLVPFTGNVLHAGSATLGLLFCALGMGYLVGAPLSRVVVARFSTRAVMSCALGGLAVVFGVAFHLTDARWAFLLFTLIGPPGVCFLVCVDTYTARHTPDRLMGRTGATYNVLQAAATLGGMVTGSLLGEHAGIPRTADLAALLVALSALAALRIPGAGPKTAAAAGGAGEA